MVQGDEMCRNWVSPILAYRNPGRETCSDLNRCAGAYVEQPMMPWLESLGVLITLLATGLALPRLARGRAWAVLWLATLTLVVLLGGLRRVPSLEASPLGCLTVGRTEYVLYGPLTLLLLGLPALRSPRRPLQVLSGILALSVCWQVGLSPFLGPVLYPPPKAHIDHQGICCQDDGFSCGPAAATSAIRRLGISADFDALARAAHTSPAIGTPPDLLCQAISGLYPVAAQTVYPDRLEDLPPGPCLLVMNLDTFIDHYVALFRVSPTQVELGDPLGGHKILDRRDFEPGWRHIAILVQCETNSPLALTGRESGFQLGSRGLAGTDLKLPSQ
jgi:hypothetical protein